MINKLYNQLANKLEKFVDSHRILQKLIGDEESCLCGLEVDTNKCFTLFFVEYSFARTFNGIKVVEFIKAKRKFLFQINSNANKIIIKLYPHDSVIQHKDVVDIFGLEKVTPQKEESHLPYQEVYIEADLDDVDKFLELIREKEDWFKKVGAQ